MNIASNRIKDELIESDFTVNQTTITMIRTYLANRWRIRIQMRDIFFYIMQKIANLFRN